MALTYYERKEHLPHGTSVDVARENGWTSILVSRVLSGRQRNRTVEIALAAKMRDPLTGLRVSVSKAFGPPAITRQQLRTSPNFPE